MVDKIKIGIIGGSCLDDSKIIENYEEFEISTPYGKPSSKISCGKIFGIDVCLLARHGKNHEIPPSQVNYRANLFALNGLGCTHIIATSAVGSLREEIKRGDFVIVDQFIDFTKQRKITFFESFEQGAKHTAMPDPFSGFLRKIIIEACEDIGIKMHKKGTVITIEGPRFSTRSESKMFRILGADIINMSIAPEAILANELGLDYSIIAMSTDYDSWKEDEEAVTWNMILDIFAKNSEKMKKLLIKVIEKISTYDKDNEDREFIKSRIRTLPNWPKPGVMFRDINSLLRDVDGFNRSINLLENRYKNKNIEIIAGIESRGFVIASALASRLQKPLVLIRKPGKLPFETVKEEYDLEYGRDAIEIQKDAIKPAQKVLIIDDLCATGGTMFAAGNLIEKLGGNIIECAFVIDLPELGGSERIKQKWPIFKLIDFEGE